MPKHRPQPINQREYWPKILERFENLAKLGVAPTRAAKDIAKEFQCGSATLYHSMQRGDIPSYPSKDRARVKAWKDGLGRYIRRRHCPKCKQRVFYTSDSRCATCCLDWERQDQSAKRKELQDAMTHGEYFTGARQFAEDRVFFKPQATVKPLKRGGKTHQLAAAMLEGANLDELALLTGWIPDVISGTMYNDLQFKGYGVERRHGRYFLLLPMGINSLPVYR